MSYKDTVQVYIDKLQDLLQEFDDIEPPTTTVTTTRDSVTGKYLHRAGRFTQYLNI